LPGISFTFKVTNPPLAPPRRGLSVYRIVNFILVEGFPLEADQPLAEKGLG
jgi:hypothetical protein